MIMTIILINNIDIMISIFSTTIKTFDGIFTRTKSMPEEIGARASIHMCTSDCPYLFGFAYAIQDLCVHKREFLVAEACQIFHLV